MTDHTDAAEGITVPVRITCSEPVPVLPLSPQTGSVMTYNLATTDNSRVLKHDETRAGALIYSTADLYVGFSRETVDSELGQVTQFPVPVTASCEVWVKPVSASAVVTVIAENWG